MATETVPGDHVRLERTACMHGVSAAIEIGNLANSINRLVDSERDVSSDAIALIVHRIGGLSERLEALLDGQNVVPDDFSLDGRGSAA